MDFQQKNIEKGFARFVLPSVFTQMLTAFYTIVDGLFIGRYAGDIGLAAVNIAWPVAAIIYAAAGGLGAGGAVLIGTRLGEGKRDGVVKARGTTLTLLFLIGSLFTIAFSILLPFFLDVLGAQGSLRVSAQEYLQVLISCSLIQIFASGFAPLLRNFGHTVSVMVIMIAGGFLNIVLDAVFVAVLHWGAAGAAVATVLAQAVTLACYLCLLFRNQNFPVHLSDFKLHKTEVKQIFAIGLSPFGLTIAPSITLLFTNWQCMRYGGNEALATYSVASYIAGAIDALLIGVGEGLQPLVSYAEGAQDHNAAKRLFHRAVRLSLFFSVSLCLICIFTRFWVGGLFGCSERVDQMLHTAMLITPLAFPLLGLSKLCSSYLYAGGSHKLSSILIYLDPLFTAPVMLLLLPAMLGVSGIWFSYPATYVIMILLASIFIHLHEKKKQSV